MKTRRRMMIAAAGLLWLALPAQAAFRDLLATYINSVNSLATLLGNIKSETDAKNNLAAVEAGITAMKNAKAQVAAASTNAAEVEAAVRERTADLQKATAELHEQTHRIKKNAVLSGVLAGPLAKLSQ